MPSEFPCQRSRRFFLVSVLTFFFTLCLFRSHHVRLGIKGPTDKPKSRIETTKAQRIRPTLSMKVYDTTKEQSSTDVFYVTARDAKTLKTALEQAGYLDKRYRMTKAETGPSLENTDGHIAVPVTRECLAIFEENRGEMLDWCSLIVARGRQQVPFSTAVLGRQQKR